MPQAAPSQTTPEEVTVSGTDIFKFGAGDQITEDGPGKADQTAATPAPPADHPGEANDDAGTPPAETTPKLKESPTRFKSHDEAERGYKELQGEHTRKAQENAELKRRLSEFESRQQQEQRTRQTEEQQAAADQATTEFARKRNRQALAEIEELDPDDKGHQDKVADVWARANTEIIRFSRNPVGADGKPITAAPAKAPQAPEETPPATPAAPTTPEATPPTPSQPRAPEPTPPADIEAKRAEKRLYIDGVVRQAGINPEDPLWIGMSLTTPAVDATGRALSLDEQIQWTIDHHNEYLAQRNAASRQSADLPIGSGGQAPSRAAVATQPTGPIGLGDAIARVNERRRL